MPDPKERDTAKSKRWWGLYLMGSTIGSRQYEIISKLDSLSDYRGLVEVFPRLRKVSRDRYIETRFYKACLSCGPLPPSRWYDVFFFQRSTSEWSQKCKELVAIVKKLSEVECEQLFAILLHYDFPLYILPKPVPESFLAHPRFLELFKKTIFLRTPHNMEFLHTPDEMIAHLRYFVDIQNVDSVKKLLYSE